MKNTPSVDVWLKEAKAQAAAAGCGMFLVHNGIVRESAKTKVREGAENTRPVKGMLFGYDAEKVQAAVREAETLEGIGCVRVWLNDGELRVGDDIMYVLIGGDIRPHVIDALQFLVGKIKNECVTETEIYE